jgi:tubulin alpha
VIAIQAGQAGVEIGNGCRELSCREHGIQPDGQEPSDNPIHVRDVFDAFVSATANTFHPQYVVLEPTAVDEVRPGTYGQLLNAPNRYARGHVRVGKEMIVIALDWLSSAWETTFPHLVAVQLRVSIHCFWNFGLRSHSD